MRNGNQDPNRQIGGYTYEQLLCLAVLGGNDTRLLIDDELDRRADSINSQCSVSPQILALAEYLAGFISSERGPGNHVRQGLPMDDREANLFL